MAIISYTNVVLPKGGLNFNPGIEEVLDRTPNFGAINEDLFELVNNDGGQYQGFKVQFTSNVNGTGDFTYLLDAGAIKPAGTITGIVLRAPDGTVIATATGGASGFGEARLDQIYSRLTNPAHLNPLDAAMSALNILFSKTDAITGTSAADHLTNFGGGGGRMNAGAGNDVLTALIGTTMIGEAGNDTFRVGFSNYEIHGGNADGSGGDGETNTIEILGTAATSTIVTVTTVTDINTVRFVDTDPSKASDSDPTFMHITFNVPAVGAGGLSTTLNVLGSSQASPFSINQIRLQGAFEATAGSTIDISRWSFTDWNEQDSTVRIETHTKLDLADVIVGSRVSDEIDSGRGDDTIRGGGGADVLSGGPGSDTFIYGANEAAPGEQIFESLDDPGTDRILVLGDNDFSEAFFFGLEILAFRGEATATFSQVIGVGESSLGTVQGDGNANTLAIKVINTNLGPPAIDLSEISFTSWAKADKVTITGSNTGDSISGSAVDDIIDGQRGSDDLQGNGGGDTFVFTFKARGIDHVADFLRKEGDKIGLDGDSFPKLKAGALKKSAFEVGGKADDKKDRILYDKQDGTLRYDDDGSGKHKAVIIGILDDAAKLKAGDILVL